MALAGCGYGERRSTRVRRRGPRRLDERHARLRLHPGLLRGRDRRAPGGPPRVHDAPPTTSRAPRSRQVARTVAPRQLADVPAENEPRAFPTEVALLAGLVAVIGSCGLVAAVIRRRRAMSGMIRTLVDGRGRRLRRPRARVRRNRCHEGVAGRRCSASLTTRGSPTVRGRSSRGSTSSRSWASKSCASPFAGTRLRPAGRRTHAIRRTTRTTGLESTPCFGACGDTGSIPSSRSSARPSWANGGRVPNWAPTPGRSFADFAYAAGRRYPWIRYWTIWNEPNRSTFLRPTTANDVRRDAPQSRVRGSCTRRSTASRSRAASRRLAPERAAASPRSRGSGRWRRLARSSTRTRTIRTRVRPQSETPWGPKCVNCQTITMADLERLEREVHRAFGRKPIWLTEYGYQTNPPEGFLGVTPEQQATYVATAALRVYRASSVTMLIFFMVRDDRSPAGWQSGLLTADGVVKPAYAAFRLPLVQIARHGGRVELWGQVRPRSGSPAVPGSARGGRRRELGRRHSLDRTRTGSSRSRSRLRLARTSGSGLRATTRTGTRSSCASPPGLTGIATASRARLGLSTDGPPRGTGRHPALRRHRRSRRRVVRRRGGADRRPHRPERRGQDHRVQRHHAPVQAGLGRRAPRRRLAPEAARVQDRAQGRRADVPEHPALPHDVRPRERARRERTAAGGRPGRRTRSRCSTSSGCATGRCFPAAALPYGIQKRVELARALVAKPRLLLLDEPAGGLNHEEVAELGEFIKKIRDDFELSVLLVEHHMNLVMSISDHVNVMSFGRQDRGRDAGGGAGRSRPSSRRTSARTSTRTSPGRHRVQALVEPASAARRGV